MSTIQQVARISLKNILVPTDFSPTSAAALPFALSLARIYGSTLLAFHVIPPEPLQQVVPDRLAAQDDRDWQEARRNLTEFAHSLQIGEIPCKCLLERGDLVEAIPAVVQDRDVDLVVLGTHGRRGVTKLLLGSAGEKIYRSSPCPVLTVGPKVHAGDWKLRRILCPVDVAEDPEPALHYALSLAEENQAEFIVMQAVPMVPWQHRVSVAEQTRRHLESLIPDQPTANWTQMMDIFMLALFGGKQRTEREYIGLAAPAGFEWQRTISAGPVDILEFAASDHHAGGFQTMIELSPLCLQNREQSGSPRR